MLLRFGDVVGKVEGDQEALDARASVVTDPGDQQRRLDRTDNRWHQGIGASSRVAGACKPTEQSHGDVLGGDHLVEAAADIEGVGDAISATRGGVGGELTAVAGGPRLNPLAGDAAQLKYDGSTYDLLVVSPVGKSGLPPTGLHHSRPALTSSRTARTDRIAAITFWESAGTWSKRCPTTVKPPTTAAVPTVTQPASSM
uniref:hypothetical protein n=1 Tax=Streptomyces sp. NBC_01592 TaxID=2975889 RepID=UPI002F917734